MTWYCLNSSLWCRGFFNLRQEFEQVLITQAISLLHKNKVHKRLIQQATQSFKCFKFIHFKLINILSVFKIPFYVGTMVTN